MPQPQGVLKDKTRIYWANVAWAGYIGSFSGHTGQGKILPTGAGVTKGVPLDVQRFRPTYRPSAQESITQSRHQPHELHNYHSLLLNHHLAHRQLLPSFTTNFTSAIFSLANRRFTNRSLPSNAVSPAVQD